MTTLIGAGMAQSVYYEGRTLDFENRPYTVRGTIMVPARETGDRIGAPLQRDDRGNRIWWQWRENRATYFKGDRNYDLNGRRMTLPTGSEDRRDVLYVPLDIFRGLTNGRLSSSRNDAWERNGPGIPGRRGDDSWDRGNGRWDDRNGRWDGPGSGNYGRDTIVFDRREIRFSGDERPYRKGSTLMVPFRQMGEAIGARTDRTADGLRVWINFDQNRVEYDKGHTWYRINGDRRDLGTISEDRNGILFVPITLFEAVTRGRVRGY
jgi:hypothetical protein